RAALSVPHGWHVENGRAGTLCSTGRVAISGTPCRADGLEAVRFFSFSSEDGWRAVNASAKAVRRRGPRPEPGAATPGRWTAAVGRWEMRPRRGRLVPTPAVAGPLLSVAAPLLRGSRGSLAAAPHGAPAFQTLPRTACLVSEPPWCSSRSGLLPR